MIATANILSVAFYFKIACGPLTLNPLKFLATSRASLVVDISSAQCFRIYGDMWSGPQALLVLSVESRCCIPDIIVVTLGIDDIRPLELSIGGIYDRSLLIKTEVVV